MPANDPQPDSEQQTGPPGRGGTALDQLIGRHGWKRISIVALALAVVVAPPTIWLIAGGSDGSTASGAGPSAERAATAGCELHDFKYAVTNDPESGRAYQREALFGSHPPLPQAGWKPGERPPSLPVVLHTLAHGWLVVKYNPNLDRADTNRLRRFGRSAGPDVAVVPGGLEMNSGFAAIRWGHGLDCADARDAALAVLVEFERVPPKL